MLDNKLFSEVRKYIFEYTKNELSPQVVYHSFKHTEEVVNAALEIGKAENISENDLIISSEKFSKDLNIKHYVVPNDFIIDINTIIN